MDLMQWPAPNAQWFCPAQGLCWCGRCSFWLWLRLKLHFRWFDHIWGTGFQQRAETQAFPGLGSYHFQDWVRETQRYRREPKFWSMGTLFVNLKEIFLWKADMELAVNFCIADSFPKGYTWNRNLRPIDSCLLCVCVCSVVSVSLWPQEL